MGPQARLLHEHWAVVFRGVCPKVLIHFPPPHRPPQEALFGQFEVYAKTKPGRKALEIFGAWGSLRAPIGPVEISSPPRPRVLFPMIQSSSAVQKAVVGGSWPKPSAFLGFSGQAIFFHTNRKPHRPRPPTNKREVQCESRAGHHPQLDVPIPQRLLSLSLTHEFCQMLVD